MRCDISTLPAATAAGHCACTALPGSGDDLDGARDAVVRRHIIGKKRTQHEYRGRARDRQWTVHVAAHLARCACDVPHEPIAARVQGNGDRDRLVGAPIALERVGCTPGEKSKRADRGVGAPSGVGDERASRCRDAIRAFARNECPQAARSRGTRGELRPQITSSLLGRAHVGEDDGEHLVA
jgi:hypothetical protein